MHAALLTLILATGGGPGDGYYGGGYQDGGMYSGGCESCECGGNRFSPCKQCRRCCRELRGCLGDCLMAGDMPQTCYDPRYGCYFGNARLVQRYPAFHGTYYRNPYHYRNVFDFPWHAEMHEPTSLFSANVASRSGGGIIDATGQGQFRVGQSVIRRQPTPLTAQNINDYRYSR